MTISNLKDLQKLIALCRRTGVQQVRVDGIELFLTDEPQRYQRPSKATKTQENVTSGIAPGGVTEDTKIAVASDWDLLTDEQKLFYSSRPETPTLEGQQ